VDQHSFILLPALVLRSPVTLGVVVPPEHLVFRIGFFLGAGCARVFGSCRLMVEWVLGMWLRCFPPLAQAPPYLLAPGGNVLRAVTCHILPSFLFIFPGGESTEGGAWARVNVPKGVLAQGGGGSRTRLFVVHLKQQLSLRQPGKTLQTDKKMSFITSQGLSGRVMLRPERLTVSVYNL